MDMRECQLLSAASTRRLASSRVPLGVNTVAVDVFDGEDLKFDLPVTTDPMYVLLIADGYQRGIDFISTTPYILVSVDFNLKGYGITREEAERLVAGFGKTLQ